MAKSLDHIDGHIDIPSNNLLNHQPQHVVFHEAKFTVTRHFQSYQGPTHNL